MRATAGGWVGLGFPATPGVMLGSTAMILKTCPTCPSGACVGVGWGGVWEGSHAVVHVLFVWQCSRPCMHAVQLAPPPAHLFSCPASGANIESYLLAAKDPSGVQPPGNLPVSGAAAAAQGGEMQGTITVQLDTAAVANPAFPLICAAGPIDSSGGLQYHAARGATSANWAAGTGGGVQGESSSVRAMKNVRRPCRRRRRGSVQGRAVALPAPPPAILAAQRPHHSSCRRHTAG